MSDKCCQNKKKCCQKTDVKKEIKDSMKLGFAFWLTVVFVILKLFGAINWSWLWVLSPIWIGYGIIVMLLTIYVVLAAIARQTTNFRFKIVKRKKLKNNEN